MDGCTHRDRRGVDLDLEISELRRKNADLSRKLTTAKIENSNLQRAVSERQDRVIAAKNQAAKFYQELQDAHEELEGLREYKAKAEAVEQPLQFVFEQGQSY